MLTNFFRLNAPTDGPIKVFNCQQDFTDFLINAKGVVDAQFQPGTLTLVDPETQDNLFSRDLFSDKAFTNVSFLGTTISGITFKDCVFIDCLFIGTRFVDCEFHDCTFKECNPHKVVFENTYIHPSVFEGMIDQVKHSNIGMHLFQQLYKNSMDMHQREFANAAEFNRQKWVRYVLKYNYCRRKKKKDFEYIRTWLINVLFYVLAGYGIRSKFWIVWAFIVAIASVGVNFFCWDSLNVVGKDGPVGERSLISVVYYTATIPGGFGDFTPASDMGRLIFLGEAFFGLFIVSLFVTWLVKQALR